MNKNKVLLIVIGIVVILLGALLLQTIMTKDIEEHTQVTPSDINQNSVSEKKTVPLGDVKGSCNLIEQASTCIEYYGSEWTSEAIKLVCEEGEYSEDPCTKPSLGGCRISIGGEAEMISWYYDRGGEPFTNNIQELNQACISLPDAAWVE